MILYSNGVFNKMNQLTAFTSIISLYFQIIDQIRSAVKKHTKSIEPVEDQYAVLKLLPRPWLQPCCDFPNCRCKEQQNQED